MKQKKQITFDDIARYTSFSKTTISRYFNHPDTLTLENQEKIANALEELNYKENKVAKSLANGQTEFIGIIIPDLYHHYYSEILTCLLTTYEDFGYKFLVFTGNSQEDVERRYLQELMSYKIEGLIILSHTIPSKELAALSIPVVTIEREDQFVCSVNTDNYMGAVQAASLLVKHGCDILIHVNSHTSPDLPAYGRLKGFQDFCEEHSIPYDIIYKNLGNTYELNEKDMQEVFRQLENTYVGKKKGIFVSSDTYANLLLNLIFRKYRKLPEDYYLIGFDNSSISREAIIPISTIGQRIDVLAHEAVKILDGQMRELRKRRPVPLAEPIHKIITPVLFRRETTEKNFSI